MGLAAVGGFWAVESKDLSKVRLSGVLPPYTFGTLPLAGLFVLRIKMTLE